MTKKFEKLALLFEQRAILVEDIGNKENEKAGLDAEINELIGDKKKTNFSIPKERKEIGEVKTRKTRKKMTRWSRLFDSCINCGTTDSPHKRKGLCNKCNLERKRGSKNITPIKDEAEEPKKFTGMDQSNSGPFNYVCLDCNESFQSVLDFEECPPCPALGCGSYNVKQSV